MRDTKEETMKDHLKHLAVEIELKPGEKLTLPPVFVASVGPGRWVITIEPVVDGNAPVRGHGAFLSGYAEGDEGLYDDYPGR